jgi:hypothetical protein
VSLELFALEGEDIIISDILVNKGLAQSIPINTCIFKPAKDSFSKVERLYVIDEDVTEKREG